MSVKNAKEKRLVVPRRLELLSPDSKSGIIAARLWDFFIRIKCFPNNSFFTWVLNFSFET